MRRYRPQQYPLCLPFVFDLLNAFKISLDQICSVQKLNSIFLHLSKQVSDFLAVYLVYNLQV